MEINDYESQIGECIRELRHKHHISQAELAEYSGYSSVYICRVEKGNDTPSIRAAENILNALGYRIVIGVEKIDEK